MTFPARSSPADVALREAARRLRDAGIEPAAREARLLLALAQGRPPGTLPDLSAPMPAGFGDLVRRRAAREPMARLRGRQGFWTLDLAMSPETLIPRADSETVIEAALAARADRNTVRSVLDLGTGTGALLLAALVEFGDAWGTGVDLSVGACRQASDNARTSGLGGRAVFVCADWAACLSASFDLILCNPPYVASGQVADLMPEVARHDPPLALDGGPDGLAAFRRVLPSLPSLLAERGVAVLEHGQGQGPAVAALLVAAGLAVVTTRADLGGVTRVTVAQKAVGAAV